MLRHYEIVLLIHPDQGEHITSTIDNYKREKKKNIPTEELNSSHEKLIQIQWQL